MSLLLAGWCCPASAQGAPLPQVPAPLPAIPDRDAGQPAERLINSYFMESRWDELEPLLARVVKDDERDNDGRPRLYLAMSSFYESMFEWSDRADRDMPVRIRQYADAFPESALAAVLPAMHTSNLAWRARGRGFASSVTPEGWALFEQRNLQAWQQLMAARERGSRLPVWYQYALTVGLDVGRPLDELMQILNEGLQRHRGYFPLYFAITRTFAPRWGGDYAAADAFIRAQVAAPTNVDGDVLYTRLYWVLDQYDGEQQSFFEDSAVDWPRMRAGFEALMRAYPDSRRNGAFFLAYACRAHDGETYVKWRGRVSPDDLADVAPEGITPEVCDARFLKQA